MRVAHSNGASKVQGIRILGVSTTELYCGSIPKNINLCVCLYIGHLFDEHYIHLLLLHNYTFIAELNMDLYNSCVSF